MIRAVVLAATFATLIILWADQPAPAKLVQVDYCKIEYKAARKDFWGEWEYGWASGYGPCSLLDRYENI